MEAASKCLAQSNKSHTGGEEGCRVNFANEHLLESTAFRPPFFSGLCMGLVAGANYVDAKSCAPEEVTNSQLVRLVLAYVEVRPQRLDEEFVKLVVEALR